MRSLRRVLGVLSALAFSGLVACSTIVGLDEPYELLEDQGCPPSKGGSECFVCGDESCCHEYADYKADSRAVDYFNCLSKCLNDGDLYFTCVLQCDKDNGGGHATFSLYYACVTKSCYAECADSNTPCTNCLAASCGNVSYKCNSSASCENLLSCSTLCEGKADEAACKAACRDGVPSDTTSKYDDLMACQQSKCATDCM